MAFVELLEGDNMNARVVQLRGSTEYVYCIAVSPDGKYLVAALGDGALVFYKSEDLCLLHWFAAVKPFDNLPCTAVRWFSQSETDYTLISVSTGGGVFIWKWDGQAAEIISRISEPGNEVTCLAVDLKGEGFLTAGHDRLLRLYDSEGTLKDTLHKGIDEKGFSRSTHTSRIFSVRYVTSNVVVSGGWSNPIQVWDMRSLESRKQISGTNIAADSIEPIPDTAFFVVTSRRSEAQLQVFNCITATEMTEDSIRICSQMGDVVPMKSVFCKESGLLWIITAKPYKVLVLSFATGDLVASFECPFPLMNIEVSEKIPEKAFVSCAEGKIIVAVLKNLKRHQ